MARVTLRLSLVGVTVVTALLAATPKAWAQG
jgi:hypothetical protein